MNIVAIDPSFRNMAFVFATLEGDIQDIVVDGYHLEQTQRASEGSRREDDWNTARKLADASRGLTEDADVVFIEQPVGSQSARSAWTLGITLGLMAAIHKPVITLSARDVKRGFTGNTAATKPEMIARAEKLFPYVDFPKHKLQGRLRVNVGKSEHIADALATLYVGIRTKEFARLNESD